jgi:dehydrogenase/reductase SDR family member 7B
VFYQILARGMTMKNSIADLKTKVVIITGASSGIGREMALSLGKAGGRVVAVARRIEKLNELKEIAGETMLTIAADVAVEADCQKVIEQTVEKFGRIDVLVNNAGISMNAKFEETDISVFKNLMDVNYFGSLYLSKFSYPHLLETAGSVFFISSVVGKRGFPTRSGYSAAKFAVQGLFESLRAEWVPQGIHVGIISPGFTDTSIRSKAFNADGSLRGADGKTAGKIMSAGDAAGYILDAVSAKKREVILTGAGKFIVGVNKFFPKLTDTIVNKTLG